MSAAMRILSLAPTQTEIIAALDGLEHLAGVTENCDYPGGVRGLPTFGSWYAPDLNAVTAARPDLVCTFGRHQEEMRATLIESGLTVYHSDPGTVAASLETILELARLMGCDPAGRALFGSLTARMDRLAEALGSLAAAERPGVFRIMHWDPLITIGPDSFQHDVVGLAGGRNVMADGSAPYFMCAPREVQARDPEVIFFCEPHIRFLLEQDPQWQRVSAVRTGRIHIFDCGLTCRSGPRIVDMVEELARAMHPSRF